MILPDSKTCSFCLRQNNSNNFLNKFNFQTHNELKIHHSSFIVHHSRKSFFWRQKLAL